MSKNEYIVWVVGTYDEYSKKYIHNNDYIHIDNYKDSIGIKNFIFCPSCRNDWKMVILSNSIMWIENKPPFNLTTQDQILFFNS
jgi:hypothetical protein